MILQIHFFKNKVYKMKQFIIRIIDIDKISWCANIFFYWLIPI